jgi:hypothetical protein
MMRNWSLEYLAFPVRMACKNSAALCSNRASKFDLILYRSLEWRISSFFRCIGQKKHDERLVMDWTTVVGARGRARFKPRSYTNRDGEERQVNDVDKFYDWDEKFFPANGGWTQGLRRLCRQLH